MRGVQGGARRVSPFVQKTAALEFVLKRGGDRNGGWNSGAKNHRGGSGDYTAVL